MSHDGTRQASLYSYSLQNNNYVQNRQCYASQFPTTLPTTHFCSLLNFSAADQEESNGQSIDRSISQSINQSIINRSIMFICIAQNKQVSSFALRWGRLSGLPRQPGRRALFVSGPSAWNDLPLEPRLMDSHRLFYRRLKSYLFQL